MAAPWGRRVPAKTVFGPPRYTSRRAAAGRYDATVGARARARSTHALVLTAVCVVMNTAPFCLYAPQPGRVSCSRQGSDSSCVPFAFLQPNAQAHLLPEAEAERSGA